MTPPPGTNLRRLLVVAIALVLVSAACVALFWNDLKRFGYSGFGRDGWQKPQQVIQALSLPQGAHVADIGAGGGYFTFRLADTVGPSGAVYAVDVDPGMTDHLKERARKEDYSNVEVILGEYDDPLLPEQTVDLVFLCNTYHHIQNRVAYFTLLRKYLRPDGRVAVVELRPGGWLSRSLGHSTEKLLVLSEMEAAGYQLDQDHDFLPRQHFLIFSQAVE